MGVFPRKTLAPTLCLGATPGRSASRFAYIPWSVFIKVP